eukprot:m.69130 g.69130  ORF g.69130 m.69130 type:complete len:161 (-) comp13716_c0_seq2:73-555(-)
MAGLDDDNALAFWIAEEKTTAAQQPKSKATHCMFKLYPYPTCIISLPFLFPRITEVNVRPFEIKNPHFFISKKENAGEWGKGEHFILPLSVHAPSVFTSSLFPRSPTLYELVSKNWSRNISYEATCTIHATTIDQSNHLVVIISGNHFPLLTRVYLLLLL